MLIIFSTISILAIISLAWVLNRVLPFKVCPICVGVFGTWLWMLAAKFLGYEIDIMIPAILMGGSVVGIAYQIEKRNIIAGVSANESFIWKAFFIPGGFVVAY